MYLNKHGHSNRREDATNNEIGPIAGIETQSIGGGMYITSDTIKFGLLIRALTISALQIFQDLSHPSALSNSTVARRSNEGSLPRNELP